MSAPLKRAGFTQPLYAISSTAKETVGTLRITKDGRKFRYAKAGTSALAAGKANIAAAIAADVMNEATANAHSIGDLTFSETITGAAAAYPQDFFAGGYLQINDDTSEGHQYLINSSSAVALAGTSIVLGLSDPLRVAMVAAGSEFTIAHNPQMGVTESTTEENLMTGVAPRVVTASYYFWNQTGGPALVLVAGTPAVGAMAAIATPLDIDIAQCYGIAWGTAGIAGEYKPVFLMID